MLNKKLKIITCGDGDSFVGITSFCDEFEIQLTSILKKGKEKNKKLTKIKIIPLTNKFDDFDTEELIINKNIIQFSDNDIERELYPIFDEMFEGEMNTLRTETNQKKYIKMMNDWEDEVFFSELASLPYKKQEQTFKKIFPNKKERDKVWDEFRKYKKLKK